MKILELFKPVEFESGEPTFFVEENVVRFLCFHRNNDNQLSLSLDSIEFSDEVFSETIDTIKNKIIETLNEFSVVEANSKVDIEKYSIDVARNSRRGVVNFNIDNIFWYNGTTWLDDSDNEVAKPNIDSPLAVVKRGDQYGIVKHPLFDILGFKAEGHIKYIDKIINEFKQHSPILTTLNYD
jgi:hypothetical protein